MVISMLKKKTTLCVIMLLCSVFLYACNSGKEIMKAAYESEAEKENTEYAESTEGKSYIGGQIEKGYDLPVGDDEREEAEIDCKKIMEFIADIYKGADKKETINDTLSDKVLYKIAERISETGSPVIVNTAYSNMENYEKFEKFLGSCVSGNCGTSVIYKIYSDGGIGREKYIYDGNEMYVVVSNFIWNDDGELVVSYISYARIKEWKYTDKGWFCYQFCVPEYPEVTEIVDGSCLIRVMPMTDENREMSEKCVLGLAYQGNNILCSNWDSDHMESLDYNGMYEYLYEMKYREKFPSEDYPDGIPKDEFEGLIMDFFPVTSEEIQSYAVFDEGNQMYAWERLGCFNYMPTYFGTSLPEVTGIRKINDGTVTLTVDAVCSMILCDDAVITHELTVQFAEDGSFQYLGNKILYDGVLKIPEYQYRIKKNLGYFHIPILDKMENEISDALLPVAFSVDWMLVAKKYVLSEVST